MAVCVFADGPRGDGCPTAELPGETGSDEGAVENEEEGEMNEAVESDDAVESEDEGEGEGPSESARRFRLGNKPDEGDNFGALLSEVLEAGAFAETAAPLVLLLEAGSCGIVAVSVVEEERNCIYAAEKTGTGGASAEGEKVDVESVGEIADENEEDDVVVEEGDGVTCCSTL